MCLNDVYLKTFFFYFFLFLLIFFLFYLDRNFNVHVLDVSSVVDCSHSSTTSAITTKHTNATKTTKRGHNKNAKRALQKNLNTNDDRTSEKELLRNHNSISMKKSNSNDEQAGTTSGNVWAQVVRIVHDTQNIVMMAMLLVLIYLFCYDRAART